MSKGAKIYYVRESAFQSIISDTYTFGVLVATIWFTEYYLDGSIFWSGVLAFMFFLSLIGRKGAKRFHTNEELIKYLNEVVDE